MRTKESVMMIEAKLDRLEEGLNELRREVDGIREDIQWRRDNGGAIAARAEAKVAEEDGTPKKRARKKTEKTE